jgi:hypothetical protein
VSAVEVDWNAADAVAAGLGLRTRQIVAERDPEAVQAWCRQMASAHAGGANALRSMSYAELAVLAGHREAVVQSAAERQWRDLLQAVQQLAATVKVKADAETKAAEEAARVEAERAESETTEAVVEDEDERGAR